MDDPQRRGAQFVLMEIVRTLSLLMAPVLSFTAEEIWQHLPDFAGKTSSVHLAELPTVRTEWINEALAQRWGEFLSIRDDILKALENARQAKKIGNALEAKVVCFAENDPKPLLQSFANLADLLQVSQFEWGEATTEAYRSERFATFTVDVQKAEGQKCERCWRWDRDVGKFSDHPTLCGRCHGVVTK